MSGQRFARSILEGLTALRRKLRTVVLAIPLWREIELVASAVTWPVRFLAALTLRLIPTLKNYEWLLEIQSLQRRHPILVAVSIGVAVYRGALVYQGGNGHGHIAADQTIYPFLAALSSYNPFLGAVCGLAFGVGDVIQKLNPATDDIFYASSDHDHLRSVLSYTVAYSALMVMGVGPGMASRVVRRVLAGFVGAFFVRRAAAQADGAVIPGGGRVWQIFQLTRPDGATELTTATGHPGGHWMPLEGPMTWEAVQSRLTALAATGKYVVQATSAGAPAPPPPAVNLASPINQRLLLDLAARNLLNDPETWRTPAVHAQLSSDERRLLGSLHAQGLLKPEADAKLQGLLAQSQAGLNTIRKLSDRGLLSDRDAGRNPDLDPPLTREERSLLLSFRGQGLLGPDGDRKLRGLTEPPPSSSGDPGVATSTGGPSDPAAPPSDTMTFDSPLHALLTLLLALPAGVLTAAAAAYALQSGVVEWFEWFGFHGFRKYWDTGCFQMEQEMLRRQAPAVADAAGKGAIAAGLLDLGRRGRYGADGGGGARTPLRPPDVAPTPPAFDPQVQLATNLQNEINEREAWLNKLRGDREGFSSTHKWESDYDKRLHTLDEDIAGEQRQIDELRDKLGATGTAPDPGSLKPFDYFQRYFPDDADNRRHALDLAEKDIRERAGNTFDNLKRMYERVRNEDTGDLKRLVAEGLVPQSVLDNRLYTLDKLGERLNGLGFVDKEGQFHGNRSDPGPNFDTLPGRVNDVLNSLGNPMVPASVLHRRGDWWTKPADGSPPIGQFLGPAQRLVGSQTGETPVVYGLWDAFVDGASKSRNLATLGFAELGRHILDNGVTAHDIGNFLTFGGLQGAQDAFRSYWSRKGTDAGGLGDIIGGALYTLGGGLAHVANNTILPFTAVRDAGDARLSADQRIISGIFGIMQFWGAGKMLTAVEGRAAAQALHEALARQEAYVGPRAIAHIMEPVARGTYLRNLLRDVKVPEAVVASVGYQAKLGAAGRLGETFFEQGKAYARLSAAALEENPVRLRGALLHEAGHVDAITRAVETKPHWFDEHGKLTPEAHFELELDQRLKDQSRHATALERELRLQGTPSDTPANQLPVRARRLNAELQEANAAVQILKERGRIGNAPGLAMDAVTRKALEYGNAFEHRLTEIGFDPADPKVRLVNLNPVARTLNTLSDPNRINYPFGNMPIIDLLAMHPDPSKGILSVVSVTSGQPASIVSKLEVLLNAPWSKEVVKDIVASGEKLSEKMRKLPGKVDAMQELIGYANAPGKLAEKSQLWVPLLQADEARNLLHSMLYRNNAYDFSRFQRFADHLKAQGLNNRRIYTEIMGRLIGK